MADMDFGSKTNKAQDKSINRPTKKGGMNQQFGGMSLQTPHISENEAMMMDTKGFNNFLQKTEEQ